MGTTFTNSVSLSASATIKSIRGSLRGFYVSSTSAGTVKIYDGIDNSGKVMFNTITPAVGFHNLGDSAFANGCYFELSGTIVLTPLWE